MSERRITIRPAINTDTPLILTIIRELANFEKLAHEVTATEERLRQHFFGPKPYVEAMLASVDDQVAVMAADWRRMRVEGEALSRLVADNPQIN